MAPVVTAALGALGPLLGKLADLLANECGRLKGVRREIRSLRSEFTSMHGALKKYATLENPDDQVKEWISLVRELAYDTEDCFDKFIRHLSKGEHEGGFREFFRRTARHLKTIGARRGIANQIDDLKARIKEAKDLKSSYKLDDDIACSASRHAAVDPRLSALFAEEAHLVGIDGPRDDLAKWMLDEGNKHHRKVLSIVGFGGLGKTTLANEVYRKIKGNFHCHAFVSVSQKPDTMKIIKDVISQVSPKGEFTRDLDIWDEKKCIAKLRELLQDKRYLVIIDDIWSVVAWNAIKCAFPENNCSSRIIATTRICEVASSCCPSPDDQIYQMAPLSNVHAERLFLKRIFGDEHRCPDMLNEVSNAILKKCGGLPLAIISISGLLANRPNVKEEWEKVQRSIGSDLNKSQTLEGMKNILSLSYTDLPPNLRTCLLYFSVFPEDYLIDRERLVMRWIAEGFISEERGRSCQEVAENYFYELINKSMVQPVDIGYDVAWNAIKCAFPENDCSSSIIATTRIFEVASSCCPGPDDQIYEMAPLSNLHAETLFHKRIFGSENCCPDMLNEVSNAILKKCGGLPLAIISISGLLANKPYVREEWEKVKSSIGSDLNKSQSLEGMKNILSLSYNDLPPNLKTCLLYLSVFPEDCEIDRERLVRRWIAEGFFSEERGRSCQEVAENHFYELINKSMVQPVDIGYDGKVRACRVHDMMLELIISKSIEENFITVVNGSQTVWENSQCFIRRLSIQHIDHRLASELAKKDLRHVRSLTVTSSSCIKHLPSLDKFESLRVLDFEDCSGLKEYDMNGMDNLFLLKYLSFEGTRISEIPSGVVMLHDLETLNLQYTFIPELPAGIVKLTKLQVLIVGIYGVQIKIPNGIGNMTNLRQISGFNIPNSTVGAVEELGNLKNLNILDVHYRVDSEESLKCARHAEMLVSSLCKLGCQKLKSLCIDDGGSSPFELFDSWSPFPTCLQSFEMRTPYSFSKFPKWIVPALTSLAFLDINVTEVTQEDLCILGDLPALLYLQVYFDTVQKGRFLVRGGAFPCLKKFGYNPFVEGVGYLQFEEGALPKLEQLYMPLSVSMAKAYGFYVGIEHLPCLKHASFSLHNRGATSSESKAAAASIRKEASLHPNNLRLTLRGEIKESSTDDEVNTNKSRADVES